ncbi:unnamed protein product [Kluyveromyces dobzhanskii CBS 2104]|uniref:Monopolar spindle protein 2 n=1 Tax=Kluyveromyces dobzhanskii CBS 2104 TaxID=1427455 RepID=A0A0A8L3Q4_9SACH|nr:unnamed protein product [Kluyveromyces dobzhanskii CBS 2104]
MDTERLLDRAWSFVDPKRAGFIYAKDIPELISFISRDLPSSITTQSNDKVIESWVNNDPMQRLSREKFLDCFSMLVGTSFDTAVQIALQSEVITPTKRGGSLFGSYRRLSNESEAPIPAEQIKSLERELQDWRDKYTFLEREFQFFLTQDKKSPQVVDNTKHEFIISELSRKLKEQDEAIEDLKMQLDYGLVPETKGRSGRVTILLRKVYNYLFPRILICLSLIFIYYCIIPRISFKRSASASAIPSFVRQQSWWEKSTILSRIQWYFKDRIENTVDGNTSDVIQNYNSVFGIQ